MANAQKQTAHNVIVIKAEMSFSYNSYERNG